jgi:hypothetical protein
MPETVAEKQTCAKCDAKIRENTAFCYNCGSQLAVPAPNGQGKAADPETEAALADLADRFKIDEEEDGRLAKAAAERRKARVTNRKTAQYVWEPSDDGSGKRFILVALLITAIAAVVVVLTVVWR